MYKNLFATYNIVDRPIEHVNTRDVEDVNDNINLVINPTEEEVQPITEVEYIQEYKPSKKRKKKKSKTYDHTISLEEMLNNIGAKYRVTSSYRPNAKTKQGRTSYHSQKDTSGMSMAYDIVPLNGNFEEFRNLLINSPEARNWFEKRGWGILDETTPEMLARTGGTGKHYHFGPDKIARDTWQQWIAAGKKGMKFDKGNKLPVGTIEMKTPEGKIIGYKIPMPGGGFKMATSEDEGIATYNKARAKYKDPSENFLNDLMFGVGGISKTATNGALSTLDQIASKWIPKLNFTSAYGPTTPALVGDAVMAAVPTALSANDIVQNGANAENVTEVILGTLPISNGILSRVQKFVKQFKNKPTSSQFFGSAIDDAYDEAMYADRTFSYPATGPEYTTVAGKYSVPKKSIQEGTNLLKSISGKDVFEITTPSTSFSSRGPALYTSMPEDQLTKPKGYYKNVVKPLFEKFEINSKLPEKTPNLYYRLPATYETEKGIVSSTSTSKQNGWFDTGSKKSFVDVSRPDMFNSVTVHEYVSHGTDEYVSPSIISRYQNLIDPLLNPKNRQVVSIGKQSPKFTIDEAMNWQEMRATLNELRNRPELKREYIIIDPETKTFKVDLEKIYNIPNEKLIELLGQVNGYGANYVKAYRAMTPEQQKNWIRYLKVCLTSLPLFGGVMIDNNVDNKK